MFKKTMVSLIFTGINFSRFYTRLVITLLHFGVSVSRPALSTIFNICGTYIHRRGNSPAPRRSRGDSDTRQTRSTPQNTRCFPDIAGWGLVDHIPLKNKCPGKITLFGNQRETYYGDCILVIKIRWFGVNMENKCIIL